MRSAPRHQGGPPHRPHALLDEPDHIPFLGQDGSRSDAPGLSPELGHDEPAGRELCRGLPQEIDNGGRTPGIGVIKIAIGQDNATGPPFPNYDVGYFRLELGTHGRAVEPGAQEGATRVRALGIDPAASADAAVRAVDARWLLQLLDRQYFATERARAAGFARSGIDH